MKKPALPSPTAFSSRLASEPNELRKKMLLLGYISERMARRNASVFLVGGQAVETYTGGVFTTGDIDITTTDTKETEALLEKLGFVREGMIWVSMRLGMAVHLVASYPRRSVRHRTFEVDGYLVKVVGVEDLVIDRLCAAKFWNSERDAEQAKALLDVFRDSIDEGYLEETARAENVHDLLMQTKRRPEQGGQAVR
jgi:hypothetical protein